MYCICYDIICVYSDNNIMLILLLHPAVGAREMLRRRRVQLQLLGVQGVVQAWAEPGGGYTRAAGPISMSLAAMKSENKPVVVAL